MIVQNKSAQIINPSTEDNQTNGLQISQIYGKTTDSTFKVPRIDETTHVIESIDYAHHEIHSGSSFTTCYIKDVLNGQNLDVLITTSNTTKWAHMTYELEGESEIEFNLYEAPTATGGTTLDIFNRDRNSLTMATVTAVHTPTVSATGTQIRCWHIGSGRSFGGGDRGVHEFILKQNTKYLFRITNNTVNNNFINLKIDWYEHTNRTA